MLYVARQMGEFFIQYAVFLFAVWLIVQTITANEENMIAPSYKRL